jgi:hypothetical protein
MTRYTAAGYMDDLLVVFQLRFTLCECGSGDGAGSCHVLTIPAYTNPVNKLFARGFRSGVVVAGSPHGKLPVCTVVRVLRSRAGWSNSDTSANVPIPFYRYDVCKPSKLRIGP